MAIDPCTPTGAEAIVEVEPDTYCDIDGSSYLGVNDKGEYFVSKKRVKIPQGIKFMKYEGLIGQRHLLVGLRHYLFYKEGDTYDFVMVGTIDVQNDVAYVSGATIKGEEPDISIPRITFPPFFVPIPFEFPDDYDIEYKLQEKMMKQMLVDGHKFNPNRPRDFYPPFPTCDACGTKSLVYNFKLCPRCGVFGHKYLTLLLCLWKNLATVFEQLS
ncbi:hypothetical protein OROHE_002315 [Orobanche hederae]